MVSDRFRGADRSGCRAGLDAPPFGAANLASSCACFRELARNAMLCTARHGTAEPRRRLAVLRFSVFGCPAGVGGRRGRLASGAAAAIPGVVPCGQDDDLQHACQGERRCLSRPTRSGRTRGPFPANQFMFTVEPAAKQSAIWPTGRDLGAAARESGAESPPPSLMTRRCSCRVERHVPRSRAEPADQ
jgi:hypothetical protein